MEEIKGMFHRTQGSSGPLTDLTGTKDGSVTRLTFSFCWSRFSNWYLISVIFVVLKEKIFFLKDLCSLL